MNLISVPTVGPIYVEVRVMTKYKLWYRMLCGDTAPRYVEYQIKDARSGKVIATYTSKAEAMQQLDALNKETAQ